MMSTTNAGNAALERLPKEGPKAYAAFRAYVDLGADRSVVKLARRLGRTRHYLERWSTRYEWQKRINDYESHLMAVTQAKAEELVKVSAAEWYARQEAQRIEEWKVRGELLEAAGEGLKCWRREERPVPTFKGIARMLDLASKLGRLSSGMPLDRTENEKEVTKDLDAQFQADLARAYPEEGKIEGFRER